MKDSNDISQSIICESEINHLKSTLYTYEINEASININKDPICYLSCGPHKFAIYKDFNLIQRKLLKWCFGLTYEKCK